MSKIELSDDMMFPPVEGKSMRESHPRLDDIIEFDGIPESELRFILTFYDRANRNKLGTDHIKAINNVAYICGLAEPPTLGGAETPQKTKTAIVTFLIMQGSLEWAELMSLTEHFYGIIEESSGRIDIDELDKKEKAYEIRNKNLANLAPLSRRITELTAIVFPTQESAKDIVSEEVLKSRSRIGTPERRARNE